MIENSMEMILLGFCVTSVMITSIIVALEVRGDRKKNRRDLNHQKIPLAKQNLKPSPEKNATRQLKTRIIQILDQQLRKLGYQSGEPQLRFLNEALKSKHKDLEELTPNELSAVFSKILNVRESQNLVANA